MAYCEGCEVRPAGSDRLCNDCRTKIRLETTGNVTVVVPRRGS